MNTKDIEARAEAATKGDWFWNGYDAIWVGKDDDSERIASVSHLEYDAEGDEVPSHGDAIFGPRKAEAGANADFIAHAREDISWLLAQLEAMREWGQQYGGWTPEEHDEFLRILEGSK